MDLIIKEFEEKLINCINEAQLPLEIKRIVLNNLMIQVERASTEAINMQLNERKKAQENIEVTEADQ